MNGHSQIKVLVETITPKKAAEWLLQEDANNRKSSPRRVVDYARFMTDGQWELNGESIKFDQNGVLVDGGHRLRAVIRSGVSVPSLVVHGASRAAIDKGRTRTTVDEFKISGRAESNQRYVTALKFLLALETYNGVGHVGVRNCTAKELEAYEGRSAVEAAWLLPRSRKFENIAPYNGAILGAMAFCLRTAGLESVTEFFDQVRSKVGIQANSGAQLFLKNLPNCGHNGREATHRQIQVTLRAMEIHCNNERRQILRPNNESITHWVERRRLRGEGFAS